MLILNKHYTLAWRKAYFIGLRTRLDDNSQGVVTYASPVEAFATGIKMESSDQCSFLEPIKGSRRILSNYM